MSLYAFLNELRLPEGKVCASDLENDREQWKKDRNYFCPSPKCTAQMRFRKSSALHCAHFYAKAPEGKHSELCSYAKLDAYNPDNFNEEAFNFKNAIAALQSIDKPRKTNQQSKNSVDKNCSEVRKPPMSLKYIHLMLKNHDCNELIGGIKVAEMLLDNRSVDGYSNDFWGNKIVEARLSPILPFYETREPLSTKIKWRLETMPIEQKIQYLPVLHLSLTSDQQELLFDIYFRDIEMFWKTIHGIWGGRGKTSPKNHFVVVAGQWHKISETENRYVTILKSKKQIIWFE